MSKPITHLLTQEVVIQRLKTTSGYKRQFQSTATVDTLIQNLTREKAEARGIVADRAFIGYFDIDIDVKIGDVVIDRYTKKYTIKEVTKKDYGINTHLETILTEFNE